MPPLHPIAVDGVFDLLGLDFIRPIVAKRKELINERGHKYVLLVTEYVTKYAWAFPTRDCGANIVV